MVFAIVLSFSLAHVSLANPLKIIQVCLNSALKSQTATIPQVLVPNLFRSLTNLNRKIQGRNIQYYERKFKEHFKQWNTIIIERRKRNARNPKNFLPFLNTKESLATFCTREFGICRGYTNIQNKILNLAHFTRSHEAMEFTWSIKNKKKFYKAQLLKVIAGRPGLFPGYDSLQDLIDDYPDFKKLLIKQSSLFWAKKNITIEGANIMRKKYSHTMNANQAFQSVQRLTQLTNDFGMNPVIYINTFPGDASKGYSSMEPHIVRVKGARWIDNGTKSIVRLEVFNDKSTVAPVDHLVLNLDSDKFTLHVTIPEKGEERKYRVRNFGIVKSEIRDHLRQMLALRKLYLKHPYLLQ